MATGGPVEELCEELICPICLDYFDAPVMIPECGHSFCRGCLTQCCGESEDKASCPLCKETIQTRNLQLNRQLANVVEIAKKHSLWGRNGGEAMQEAVKRRVCEKHWEPLKLFCQTDQVLICLVCDRSKEHKNHEVIPAGEAFEEYKDKIFRHLETLKTERERILAYLEDAENESQELLKIAELEKEKTEAEFRKLRQLLKEEEDHLLAQMEEMEKEIARRRDEHLARLSEELSSLESLIREMEEKHQQPVNELLQDVRSTLQRCEQKVPFENAVAFPPELKRKLRGCCDIGPCLGGVWKKFRGNVTLDPITATMGVILSEDRRSVRYQRDAKNESEKKDGFGSVHGHVEFRGGCHFWEVSVGNEDAWGVGVAEKPVRRSSVFTPESGFWLVGRYNGNYKAYIEGSYPPLSLSGELKRVRVCLDYDGGQVEFFDADAETLLYAFSGVPFTGQTISPFFAVYDKGYLSYSS